MNKSTLVTFLGVVTAVSFAVAPELTQVDATVARYVMLAGVAAAAAGKQLRPADVRELRGLLGQFPRRGMFASRKARR